MWFILLIGINTLSTSHPFSINALWSVLLYCIQSAQAKRRIILKVFGSNSLLRESSSLCGLEQSSLTLALPTFMT